MSIHILNMVTPLACLHLSNPTLTKCLLPTCHTCFLHFLRNYTLQLLSAWNWPSTVHFELQFTYHSSEMLLPQRKSNISSVNQWTEKSKVPPPFPSPGQKQGGGFRGLGQVERSITKTSLIYYLKLDQLR